MGDFERQYFNELAKPDPIYQAYYDAWFAYHDACERFDRQISPDGRPRTREQHSAMLRNAREMREKYLSSSNFPFTDDAKKFQRAKLDALRDVEQLTPQDSGREQDG